MSKLPLIPATTANGAAIAILDRDGIIVEINDAWRMFARSNGYRGDSFGLGEPYLMHCEAGDSAGADCQPGDVVTEGLRAVLSGEQPHFMHDYSCHSPVEQRWFRLVVTPRSFAHREGVVVAHIPVTREKELEIALRESQRRLNEIYHIADIGDFEYNVEKNQSWLSPPVMRIWGRDDLADGSREQFFASIHADDRQRVECLLGDHSKNRLSFNYKICRADGEIRHIVTKISREYDEKGNYARLFGLHQDVTDRTLAEERLNSLFDASIEVLTIISFKGYFKRVNPAFVKLMGYSAEELMSRPCVEFIHPDDRERTVQHVMAQVNEGDREKIENRYIRKDGSVAILSWSMSASGRDMLGVARDVTADRTAALALRQAKEAAEAANLAKSEFLATMSHEIRTPLNGVIGMADLLRTTPLSATQKEQVETIHDSGRVLLTLLNDILDLSRIEAGKLELEQRAFDLRQAARSLTDLWSQAAAAKGLAFASEVAADVPTMVEGDEVRVRQVLGNLLANAVKFTESGKVTFRISMGPAAGMVQCEVTDTGPGIDKEVQTKLFEKFSQGDASVTRKHGGTGLGLAISKQLAELMGGTISVTSSPGAGSTFSVTFRIATMAHASTPSSPLPEIRSGSKLNILVAEDNAINRKLIALMLEALGHTCSFAEDGQQAVAKVSEADFDLILMDVQMPVMDGLGATKVIRQLGTDVAKIPIVAVTANAMSGDKEKYLAAGMDNYVSKPISLQSLMNVLDELKITPKVQAQRAAG